MLMHRLLGETVEEKVYLKRGLEILLKKLRPDHVDAASPVDTLHSMQSEKDDAKDHYKWALTIQLTKLRPEHVDVASSYKNLGALHSAQGRNRLSKNCYRRALEA